MITHHNMLAAIEATLESYSFYPKDIYISYLPLAHIQERFCIFLCMSAGSRIGFWLGSILKLKNDVRALKPTLFMTVPSVLTNIYEKIQRKLV